MRAAHERAVSPNSVTGIGLLIGLCGAAWYSGGTRPDSVFGLAALGAWALARTAAWYLAAAAVQLDQPKRKLVTRATVGFGWFFAITTTAAECAVYGGIAAGAEAVGWTGMWSLAVIAVILTSVGGVARRLVPRGRDRTEAADPERSGRTHGRAGAIGGRLGSLISVPPSIKLLLAGILMVGYGPRITLFAVSVIGAVSLIGAVVRLATGPVRRDMVIIARDDGPFARWVGRLVRGNLVPLPPALAGLLAIGLLASLGMRNLPDVVALTPVVVLLLAAPGSSNRHDRKLDWLVPLLLCLSQYVYIAALGAARSVPGPVIFATCAMIAIWYSSLVAGRALNTSVTQTRGDEIGWEGRVTIIGLAAMFGIATLGYLGLAAGLAALLCRKAARAYRPAG